jgi:hypothetical protein
MKNALPLAAATPAALSVLAPYVLPAIVVVGVGLAVGAVLADLFGADDKPSAESEPDASSDMHAASVETRPDADALSLGGPVDAFDRSPSPSARPSAVRPSCRSRRATRDDLETIFAAGPLSRSAAASALRQRIGCGRTAAYRTLSPGSRLSAHLREDESGRLSLMAVADGDMSQD